MRKCAILWLTEVEIEVNGKRTLISESPLMSMSLPLTVPTSIFVEKSRLGCCVPLTDRGKVLIP